MNRKQSLVDVFNVAWNLPPYLYNCLVNKINPYVKGVSADNRLLSRQLITFIFTACTTSHFY